MEQTPVRIVVAAFPTEDGAGKALDRLKQAGIQRGNVALISRDENDKLRIKETHDWGMGKAALVGGVAAVLLPGVGVIFGAAAGALAAKLIDVGFPDESLKRMGAGLKADSSAIIVLVDEALRGTTEQALLDAGGQVVSGGLDANLADQVVAEERAVAQSGDATPPAE